MDEGQVKRARADTPGAERVAHLNNAGASLMPTPVVEAQRRHIEREAAIGGYEAQREAAAELDATYGALAELLGCRRDEIAVVDSSTTAWDVAFWGLGLGPGDRILTSRVEYASNYIAFLRAAQRTGAVVEPVPSTGTGEIDVGALEARIDRRTRLVALTHIPTNGGLVNPAAEVGAVCRRAGVPYLLDACQSVGQMPIDVGAIGCDFLAAAGRKFLRGPRGTGFLYVRRDRLDELDPPRLDLFGATWTEPDRYELRRDARRFELWERNVAAVLGLGAAARYAVSVGLEAIERRVTALADELRSRLAEIPAVTVRDLGAKRCGIVSFTVAGRDPEEVREALARASVHVLTSSPASTLLDMRARKLPGLVRASVHYFNSAAELDRAAAAVRAMAAE